MTWQRSCLKFYIVSYPPLLQAHDNNSLCVLVPRPLSNDPWYIQCIYCYSHASKRFVDVLLAAKKETIKQKKRLVQVYIQNASTRPIYLSISTSDGSKIGRVYTVARQVNSDCNCYF